MLEDLVGVGGHLQGHLALELTPDTLLETLFSCLWFLLCSVHLLRKCLFLTAHHRVTVNPGLVCDRTVSEELVRLVDWAHVWAVHWQILFLHLSAEFIFCRRVLSKNIFIFLYRLDRCFRAGLLIFFLFQLVFRNQVVNKLN